MAMVPTPTTPGMGYDAARYRGVALAQLRILKQQMQLGGLNIGNREVKLDDGTIIRCEICFNREDVFVKTVEQQDVWVRVRVPWRGIRYSNTLFIDDETGSFLPLPIDPVTQSDGVTWNIGRADTVWFDCTVEWLRYEGDPVSYPSIELAKPLTDYLIQDGYFCRLDMDQVSTSSEAAVLESPSVLAVNGDIEGVQLSRPGKPAGVNVAAGEGYARNLVVGSPTCQVDYMAAGLSGKLVWINVETPGSATGFENIFMPYLGLTPVAISKVDLNGDPCLIVACELSYRVTGLDPETLELPAGQFGIFMVQYNMASKVWSKIDGPLITTMPYDLTADYEALNQLGENGGIFPYKWYLDYGYAYMRWNLQCRISSDGLSFGFMWTGGTTAISDRPDSWIYDSMPILYRMSLENGLDSYTAYINYADFYYHEAGYSDLWTVGGQSEFVVVRVADDGTYAMTNSGKRPVSKCFEYVEGEPQTLRGHSCKHAWRENPVMLRSEASDVSLVYLKEYVYSQATPYSVVIENGQPVNVPAFFHGFAITLRNSPTTGSETVGANAEYPQLSLILDEIVLHAVESENIGWNDPNATWKYWNRERYCVPLLGVNPDNMNMPAVVYGDLFRYMQPYATHACKVNGAAVWTTALDWISYPITLVTKSNGTKSPFDVNSQYLLFGYAANPTTIAPIQNKKSVLLSGSGNGRYVHCPSRWPGHLSDNVLLAVGDHPRYLTSGVEALPGIKSLYSLYCTRPLDFSVIGGQSSDTSSMCLSETGGVVTPVLYPPSIGARITKA